MSEQSQSLPQNEQTPTKLKQYTREYSPQERKLLAESIKQDRRLYFERKKNLQEKIQELSIVKETSEQATHETIAKIKEIRAQLQIKDSTLLNKIVDFLKIVPLRKKLAVYGKSLSQLTADYQESQELLRQANEHLNDKTDFETARKKIGEFYRGKTETWKLHEEEEKIRDVKNIMQTHGVIFVHGVQTEQTLSHNSLVQQGVDYNMLFRIVTTLNPTISTSTLSPGDGQSNMWSVIGVLINGGRVLAAESHDLSTVATGLKTRHVNSFNQEEPIEKQVKTAITKRSQTGYNELVVESPNVVGAYISFDGDDRIRMSVSHDKLHKISQELGLPLFVIKNGKVFSGEFDPISQKIIQEKEIVPDTLYSLQDPMPLYRKQEERQKIFEESPFIHYGDEAKYFDGYSFGRNLFLELVVGKNPSLLKNPIQIKDTTTINVFASDGKRLVKKIYRREKEVGESNYIYESPIDPEEKNENGIIWLGASNDTLGIPVNDAQSYLNGMEKRIAEVIAKYPTATDWISKLTYHLYGFGEQAGQFSMPDIKEKAFALAQKVIDLQAFEDFKRRRIGKDGGFRISEEDIGGKSKKRVA